MVLFGSMSGRLLGRFTAEIIVNVVFVAHVFVEGQKVALDESKHVYSSGLRQFLCFIINEPSSQEVSF